MRILLVVIFLTLISCGESSRVDSSQEYGSAYDQIVGQWQSENFGLDFPIWMVDTYHADGTVITEFYSKASDEVIRHDDKTRTQHWRLHDGALELGHLTPEGEFEIEFRPRRIHVDEGGKVLGVGTFTRVE